MKKLTIIEAEALAGKFRYDNNLNLSEPISAKTLLRKLNILTMYRPLSSESFGISCKASTGKMFMMINSNCTRGRQHFTIAHELYHLYYDENPTPHMCGGVAQGEEKNANLFASALLLPREGILSLISTAEIRNHKISFSTILRMEQFFQVSRKTLLLRLKDINILTQAQADDLMSFPVKESAKQYGYETSLYEPGNEGLTIGDFGSRARMLFESGRISEGHYLEMLNMISDGRE